MTHGDRAFEEMTQVPEIPDSGDDEVEDGGWALAPRRSAAAFDPPARTETEEEATGSFGAVRLIVWAAMSLGFVAFLIRGRIMTHPPAPSVPSDSAVWDVWTRLAGDLPKATAPGAVRVIYVVSLAVILLGSLLALWLALAADRPSVAVARSDQLFADGQGDDQLIQVVHPQ